MMKTFAIIRCAALAFSVVGSLFAVPTSAAAQDPGPNPPPTFPDLSPGSINPFPLPDTIIIAAQGGPDPHLFALNTHHPALWAIGLPNGEWLRNWPSEPPVELTQIAVQSGLDAHIFGLDKEGNIWACGIPTGVWIGNWPKKQPVAFVNITAQGEPDPHLFALDINHDLWAIGLPNGEWLKNWPKTPPGR